MDVLALTEWFHGAKRSFPWREEPTPYRVWVSEVMLQQTQAVVVVPYFERWMSLFPTVEALAAASLEEVMKAWEGLGYYARARNLHAAARTLTEKYGGAFPSSRAELLSIKGLGPYTVGAILSFSFHQRAPAIDGNVSRVLTRYFLIEEDVRTSSVQKKLHELTEQILPKEEPWVVMEALIELGACVCKKAPLCSFCPLKRSCRGFQSGKASLLPQKKKSSPIQQLHRSVAVIFCGKELLLRKEEIGKVMGGLHEFPYVEGKKELSSTEIQSIFGLTAQLCARLDPITHSFTRYKSFLYPSVWQVAVKREVPGYFWTSTEALSRLPFSSGHRRVLQQIELNGYPLPL